MIMIGWCELVASGRPQATGSPAGWPQAPGEPRRVAALGDELAGKRDVTGWPSRQTATPFTITRSTPVAVRSGSP